MNAALTTRNGVARATYAVRNGSDAGFSLIEVLVTLAIMALASSFILATARPADLLRSEAERLSTVLDRMNTRARITGTPTGLHLESTSYAALTWQDGQWAPLPNGRHVLGEGMRFDGDELAPATGQVAAQGAFPQIVFDPLGHSVMPALAIRAGHREIAIAWPAQETLR